jgi:hypothetical protein
MAPASSEHAAGFPFRQLAAQEGVVFPDHFVYVGGVGSRQAIERIAASLRPGVTEVYVHPAVDTPELRAIDDGWEARVDDLDLVSATGVVASAVADQGAITIGWREMRDLMRAEAA